MSDLLADLRYAFRSLRNHPGFTALVVVTLALGIGANTTVFSAVYAVLLSRAPFAQPDRLRIIRPTLRPTEGRTDTMSVWSYPAYEAFRTANPQLTDVAAYTPRALSYNLAGTDQPQRVGVELVSGSYFGVLGVPAALGRGFAPEEDLTPGTHPVTILSDDLWRRAFGADSGVVGRAITLNTVPFTVIGIMPAGFAGLSERADAWAPMMMAPTLTFRNRLRGALSFWHAVVARLPAGVTAPEWESRLATSAPSVQEALPLEQAFGPVRLGFASLPLADTRVNPVLARALLVLLGVVGFVLLIACANVANLQLARGARRTREIGVRIAMGVSRGRLVRHLVTESLVLGVLGGAGALAIAVWGVELVASLRPPALAGTVDIGSLHLSGPVLGFNFAVALAATALFGALPALVAARSDPRTLLATSIESRHRRGPLGALVAIEVALAVVLLIGASLLTRSFARLQSTPLGFDPRGLVSAYVNVPRQAYDSARTAQLFSEATRRLAAVPGVRHAAAANCLPLAGGCDHPRMHIRNRAEGPQAGYEVWMNMVTPSYFATLGIPLVGARTFTETDHARAPRVAIVTHAAAQQYWPGQNPVGERIQLTVGWGPEDDWAEVVGVVGDVPLARPDEPATPGVYLSFPQYFYLSNYLIAQTDGDPGAAVAALRNVLADLDPNLSLWDVQTMTDRTARATASERFSTVLLGVFGLLALALGAVGIYGVLSFSVAGRTRELGVRMAVGARSGDVLLLVVRDGLRYAIIGMAAGLVAAFFLVRLLRDQLYAVSPTDPLAFGAAVAVLGLAVVAACYVPAQRAARVDPMVALRSE
ncbi:MAG TPA: ABC transporter permease [Gemmatimonadales bacterium]